MVKTILFGIVLGMSVLSIGYLLVRGNVLSRIHMSNAFTLQTEVELPVQVLRELQGMQEIHTASFSIQTVVTGENRRKVLWYIPFGRTRMLYVAVGEVRAGVDLGQLNSENIRIQHNTLHIKLPAVQVLDFKLDVSQSRIYDVRRSLFLAPDASLLHQDIQQQALEQTREAALKSGILATAEQNAVRMVKGLFSDLGYTIEVEMQPAT